MQAEIIMLLSGKYDLKEGDNYYILNTDHLNNGMYLITVSINEVLIKTEKFIIIR